MSRFMTCSSAERPAVEVGTSAPPLTVMLMIFEEICTTIAFYRLVQRSGFFEVQLTFNTTKVQKSIDISKNNMLIHTNICIDIG